MDKNLLGYKGVKPVFLIVGFLTLVQSLSILLLAKSLAEVVSALFAGEPLKEQGLNRSCSFLRFSCAMPVPC